MTINQLEKVFLEKYKYIIGVDEAGRGPWAGPVTIGAVLLDVEKLNAISALKFLNDSKKLNHKKREILDKEIKECVKTYTIADISHEIIDEINILEATKTGILSCLEDIINSAQNINSVGILIDGKFNNIKELISELGVFQGIEWDVETVVDGDALCPSISAASILAKEHRDRLMHDLHKIYPEYGFDKHKGYGTKFHSDMLKIFGPSDIHRKSFRPIRELLN
ncbi:MAG: ribonuclease HII [bacterium]